MRPPGGRRPPRRSDGGWAAGAGRHSKSTASLPVSECLVVACDEHGDIRAYPDSHKALYTPVDGPTAQHTRHTASTELYRTYPLVQQVFRRLPNAIISLSERLS